MTKVLGKYVIINRFDVGKATQDLLRDLLYESTGARIPGDKIIYGKPRALDQRPGDLYDPNTFIPVIVDIVYDTRFRTDGDGFMYRRRSIIEHTAGVDFTKITPEFFPFRISDIIDQINSYLEYPISMNDLVEYEYTTAIQWARGVRLQARDDSYLWMDGKDVMIDTTLIGHDNLLTNHVLDGFNIYQQPNGPYVIAGFEEHRGGCGQAACPICSPTGIVDENTPQYILDYLDMTQRERNPSYRVEPTSRTPLPVEPGNALTITPPDDENHDGTFCASPPEADDRPQPIVDGETSPYHSFTQTSCGHEVNMEYYAPVQDEPIVPPCDIDGGALPPQYPGDQTTNCPNAEHNYDGQPMINSCTQNDPHYTNPPTTSNDCNCGGTCGNC